MSNPTVQALDSALQKICANLDCGQILSGFDLTNTQRFCRRCRISNRPLYWKCGICDVRMSNTYYRETRKKCDRCARRI